MSNDTPSPPRVYGLRSCTHVQQYPHPYPPRGKQFNFFLIFRKPILIFSVRFIGNGSETKSGFWIFYRNQNQRVILPSVFFGYRFLSYFSRIVSQNFSEFFNIPTTRSQPIKSLARYFSSYRWFDVPLVHLYTRVTSFVFFWTHWEFFRVNGVVSILGLMIWSLEQIYPFLYKWYVLVIYNSWESRANLFHTLYSRISLRDW
jgi:hypothetical protein